MAPTCNRNRGAARLRAALPAPRPPDHAQRGRASRGSPELLPPFLSLGSTFTEWPTGPSHTYTSGALEVIAANPTVTQAQLAELYKERFGVEVSARLISSILKRMEYTRKKGSRKDRASAKEVRR